MIAYLTGTLTRKDPTYLHVETRGGVAYRLNVSLQTYEAVKDLEEARLYTHLQVKDDAHVLYGFADEAEQALFQQLLGVSGVGGSMALLLLSSLPAAELRRAISEGDVPLLKKVKGIGEKTAKRLVLELQGRLPQPAGDAAAVPAPSSVQDAVAALIGLGYPRAEAEQKVRALVPAGAEPPPVDALIRQALQLKS